MSADLIGSLVWAHIIGTVGIAWAVAWAARRPITVNVNIKRDEEL